MNYWKIYPFSFEHMNSIKNLAFYPVDKSRWADLEKLFESKGGPHHCWCMVWRNMIEGKKRTNKSDKRNSLKRYVDKRIPIGIICYADNEPIAWCSVAPRESYRELGGQKNFHNVWSIVCFYIKRSFRNLGLTHRLIEEAVKYAKNNGAGYVEAYPVDPDSPSYRFMGITRSFKKAGFEFRKKAGSRRNVMVLHL